MAGRPGEVQRSLQTLFRLGTLGGESDGRLLERFLDGPDDVAEAAFAALVDRHGAMVLGLCRRVLDDPHDAEDAAQATFLVLARRARSVRRRESLGSWLFGVARRIARRARCREARRRLHEARKAEMATPRASRVEDDRDASWPELYEELGRLPEACRAPLVLCYLEGLTNEQAADALGLPLRTVQRRLAQGRERLRGRLERRGVVPSSGFLMSAKAAGALSSRPPAAWVEVTVRAAIQVAANPAAAGAASTGSYHLAKETVKAMFLAKLKVVSLAAMISGAALLGTLPARPWEAIRVPGPVAVATPGQTVEPPVRRRDAPPEPARPDGPREDEVDRAIRAAVSFLKSQQQADGTWDDADIRVPQGTSALATYALLVSGEPIDDPHVRRALDNLGRFRSEGLGMTYSVALRAAALSRADPERYRDQIAEDVRWLEDAQIRPGDPLPWPGSWTYDLRKASQGDNSNTQYALLGLHAAREAGFEVRRETWELARSYWLTAQRQQGPDAGGWGYYPDDRQPASGNLGCAGLAGLLICDAALAEDPVPRDIPGFAASTEAVTSGLAWLAEHFRVAENPGKGRLWKYSYLASLARLGRALGQREIGGHDWYREGAEHLMGEPDRDAERGAWAGLNAESRPVVATSFVLLFLADAREPAARRGAPAGGP